jgi:hypothetical protein
MTSSCCSCHHAAHTWPRWPPGPSNEAYLSSPHLEASLATTFRACSSPAPTPVKPQPSPAIFSQESVHTTLSITHHTRKRPSTGPRSTRGPQIDKSRENPPWWKRHQVTRRLAVNLSTVLSRQQDAREKVNDNLPQGVTFIMMLLWHLVVVSPLNVDNLWSEGACEEAWLDHL